MATHGSAIVRERAPHLNRTTHVNRTTRTATILNALTERAGAILNDESIDTQTRAILRYGLETNDPWLAELVMRVDAGESISETFDFSQTTTADEDSSDEQKLEALAEIICRAGEQPAAALLVLMRTLESSANAKVLARTTKHLAFTHCGQLNLYGMVDAQIAAVERELWAR